MMSLDGTFDDWSDRDSHETSSASDTSSSFVQNNMQRLSYQPEAGDIAAASHSLDTDQSTQSAIHTPSISTRSRGSDGISRSPCDGSVCSFPPHRSAPRDLADASASTSRLSDPILEHIASHTSLAARTASLTGQTADSGSLPSSAGSTESDETDSQSTPDTSTSSEATQEADHISLLDAGHHDHAAGILDRASSLLGLGLPEESRNRPYFCDANDDNAADAADICEVLNELLKKIANLQAGIDAEPWTQIAEDSRRRNSDGIALAHPPGPAYNEYYSPIRNYTRRHQKIQRYHRVALGRNAQPIFAGYCDEPPTATPESQRDISPYAFAQWSSEFIHSQSNRFRNCYDRTLEPLPQPRITRQIDPETNSDQTFVSNFHPSFLVSHLSPSSISTLSEQLYHPGALVHNFEHDVGFELGFGPQIFLKVCTFTPRDPQNLRSYQKHEGKDTLHVEESLPIVLNVFPLEVQAEELDRWLDGIIDSESGLLEYAGLIIRRQNNDLSSLLLKVLISWYLTSKNKLSRLEYQILRPAIKLLITTTLLSLAPRVTKLPETLLHYLSSHYPVQFGLSGTAPRLLTRQMKGSLFFLQQQFLSILFSHFECPMRLPAEVKIAVAFLVAYVLDLVRNAGREFAKHSRAWNPDLVVSQQKLMEYETDIQVQLFDRVHASLRGAGGRTGGLADSWRKLDPLTFILGSILKGKDKEGDEDRFVSAIVEGVL